MNFLEYSQNGLMLAEKWHEPNLGGGPAKDLPMRSEHFTYINTEEITDRER